MTTIPLWVRAVYAVIQWADRHPIYLLPSRLRWWRYQLMDDACGCENCEDRRRRGMQGPRKWGREAVNANRKQGA